MRMSRRMALYAANNNAFPKFTYTGLYDLDETGSYPRLRLLGAGILTFERTVDIDIFLVGGGGGTRSTGSGREGGGGGGYTVTDRQVSAIGSTAYSVFIGAGGTSGTAGDGSPTYIDGLSSAAAGGKKNPTYKVGGDGGSGGGGSSDSAGNSAGNGGSDGSDGEYGHPTDGGAGGAGQGTTTREFGETDNPHIYAGGGAGGSGSGGDGIGGAGGGGDSFNPGAVNTGGGGGSRCYGGSGIIVIRKARKAA